MAKPFSNVSWNLDMGFKEIWIAPGQKAKGRKAAFREESI
jgi:hypothetical protein